MKSNRTDGLKSIVDTLFFTKIVIPLIIGMIITLPLVSCNPLISSEDDADAESDLCGGANFKEISTEIIGTNIEIEVNLTYRECYQVGTNETFNLTATANQLNGFVVPIYIQIIMETEREEYQFLSHLGGTITMGSPYDTQIEMSGAPQGETNNTAKIWFKLGYLINGTDFGQINSTKSSEKTVEILVPGEGGDPNEGKIWFLFFPLEPYQFALVVIAIIILSVYFIWRGKRKKLETKPKKNKNS